MPQYIATLNDQVVHARSVNEAWIYRFRGWLTTEPFTSGKKQKFRSPATVENSVVQLAAATNWAREPVDFRPIPLKDLTNSPSYRADVATLASMFRYTLANPRRASLLAFLRLGVISWARPDPVMDASTEPRRGQWHSAARVFSLKPVGRRQTRKYRATVPIPECVAWWLDEARGPLGTAGHIEVIWRRMERALALPGEGQSECG